MRKHMFIIILIFVFLLSACRNDMFNNTIDISSDYETNIDESEKPIQNPAEKTVEIHNTLSYIDSKHNEVITETGKPTKVCKNKNYLVTDILSSFAYEPRRLRTVGHENAIDFISANLQSNGWNVDKKRFSAYRYPDVFGEPYNLGNDESDFLGEGVNIIAELPSYDSSKNTLILSAHYDTTRDNIGIIDNGTGTAFLLAAAEMLSTADLSYNLQIIFFDLEEYSMYGSKYYLQSMSDKEREKIIANINFDMIGSKNKELKIATSNGLESVLEIYISNILYDKYNLSEKGMHSDSGSFMHYQIPAVTFIDESLPLEAVESNDNLELLSDDAFNDMLADLTLILNNLDEAEFEKIKNECTETVYTNENKISASELYSKMLSLNIPGFKKQRSYTKMYKNGISACFCCEYASNDGRSFLIESLSEITRDDIAPLLQGIPTFEDCKNTKVTGEILVDEMQGYKIRGDLSDGEAKMIWTYIRNYN